MRYVIAGLVAFLAGVAVKVTVGLSMAVAGVAGLAIGIAVGIASVWWSQRQSQARGAK